MKRIKVVTYFSASPFYKICNLFYKRFNLQYRCWSIFPLRIIREIFHLIIGVGHNIPMYYFVSAWRVL
jgi:hypothetical protein